MTTDLSNKTVEELRRTKCFRDKWGCIACAVEVVDELIRRLEEAQQRIALAKAEAMEELHAELMARYLGWDEWVLRAIKGKAAEYRAKATEAGRKE